MGGQTLTLNQENSWQPCLSGHFRKGVNGSAIWIQQADGRVSTWNGNAWMFDGITNSINGTQLWLDRDDKWWTWQRDNNGQWSWHQSQRVFNRRRTSMVTPCSQRVTRRFFNRRRKSMILHVYHKYPKTRQSARYRTNRQQFLSPSAIQFQR